jgi:hypothetical protein
MLEFKELLTTVLETNSESTYPIAKVAALTAKNATKVKLPKQYKQQLRTRNKELSTRLV